MKKFAKLSLMVFLLISISVSSQTVNVTFRVDMSNQNISPQGIHIAGSFNSWNPGITEMTFQGDNVFSVTLQMNTNDYHEFKYINGNAWGSDESVPYICANNNNRFFTVPINDTILPAVCFGSCDPCAANPFAYVTFRVDMSNETVSPDGVHFASDIQGWNPSNTIMTNVGNGIWELTFLLETLTYHEFKFINGNEWGEEESVPWYCSNNTNRFIYVPENDTILPAVCYGFCYSCISDSIAVTFSVDMSTQVVSSDGVHIAGYFQNWNPASNVMSDMGNDIYQTTIYLDEEYTEFKFINGDEWGEDELIPEACNMNGNRFVVVPELEGNEMDLACFASCDTCLSYYYSFNLSVFLEGAFNGTDMNTTLYDNGLIPANQPYNQFPWNYNGTEVLTASPTADIVDWVFVEFRETTGDASTATFDKFIDHQAAILLSDGSIVQPDGVSPIIDRGIITENLFVIIYHRNHLPVMSATALVESKGNYVYDFTNDISKAYLDGQKALSGGLFGMIGGDCDGSGTIDMDDKDSLWVKEAGIMGYYGSDINMDFQVNNLDKNEIWDVNFGLATTVTINCGFKIFDIRDGQTYETYQIGDQCWMAENLNIGNMILSEPFNNDTIEKYCFNNDVTNCKIYGGLYRWNEMMEYLSIEGSQGICPTGWHIPSDEEWKELEGEVDNQYNYPDPIWDQYGFRGSDAGGNLKETGTIHWQSPNTGATNSSGFSGLGSSYREYLGGFGNLNQQGFFWTSSSIDNNLKIKRELKFDTALTARWFDSHAMGFSVRCLRD